MFLMGVENKGFTVDRGGYRKRDGTLANKELSAKPPVKKVEVKSNQTPVADETTVDVALEHVDRLIANPDKTS